MLRGALAGIAGTSAMTAAQTISAKLQSSSRNGSSASDEDPWETAPAPAKVAKRISEGVFHHDVSSEQIPLLSNAMHWSYGIGWGIIFGLAVAGRTAPAARRGAIFGAAVWTSSYLQLVPMGIYEPPWKYKPQELALDFSYHLAFGLTTATTFHAIER